MAPRGLASANCKLIRAKKHLKAIKRAMAIYAAANPHEIVTKPKGKKKLNISVGPPIEISLLAGEMVYQMRSALDYLAFDLIKRNPNILAIDPDWEEHCEFPIWTKPLKPGQKTPLPKSRFARLLPGIADAPFTFIESIQPYYGTGAVNNALRFLGYLSNIDKHRRLSVTRARVRQVESVRFPGGNSGKSWLALDHGAEINPSPPMRSLRGEFEKPVLVKRHYRTFVAFNEKNVLGEANTLPIDYFLDLILNEITAHIVPAFEKFIKKGRYSADGRTIPPFLPSC